MDIAIGRKRRPTGAIKKLPELQGTIVRYRVDEDVMTDVVAGRAKNYTRLRLRLGHPRSGTMHLCVSDSRQQLGPFPRSKPHLERIMNMWDVAYENSDAPKMRDLVLPVGEKLPESARYPEVFIMICCDLIRLTPTQYRISQHRSDLMCVVDPNVHSELFFNRMYKSLNSTVLSTAVTVLADAPNKSLHGPFQKQFDAHMSRLQIMRGVVDFGVDMSAADKMMRVHTVFYHDTAPKHSMLEKLLEPLEFHAIALQVFEAMSGVSDLEVATVRKSHYVDKAEIDYLVVDRVVNGEWVHKDVNPETGDGQLEFKKLKKPKTTRFAIPKADGDGNIRLQAAGALYDRKDDVRYANSYFKMLFDALMRCYVNGEQRERCLLMVKDLIGARWPSIHYPPKYVGVEVPLELKEISYGNNGLLSELFVAPVAPNAMFVLLSAKYSDLIMEYEVFGIPYDANQFGVRVPYDSMHFPEARNEGAWLLGADPWIKNNFHLRKIDLSGVIVSVDVVATKIDKANVDNLKNGDPLIVRKNDQDLKATYMFKDVADLHVVCIRGRDGRKFATRAKSWQLFTRPALLSETAGLETIEYAIFHNRFGWLPRFNTTQFQSHSVGNTLASQSTFHAMLSSMPTLDSVSQYAQVTKARSITSPSNEVTFLPLFTPTNYKFVQTSTLKTAIAPVLASFGIDASAVTDISCPELYRMLDAFAITYATQIENWPTRAEMKSTDFGVYGPIFKKCT